MKNRAQLAQLGVLGQLLLDGKLAALRASARARQESEELLAGLRVPDLPEGTLPGMGAELVSFHYNRWADLRRAEINQTLARQIVAVTEAQDDAREAFARLQALNALRARKA